MTRRPLALAALIATSACAAPRPNAPADPAPPAAESAEILSTVAALFDAMASRDTTALARLVTRDGVFAVIVIEGDSVTRVAHQSLGGFITSIGQPGPRLLERAWASRVMIDGPFATVWTPYDFHVGERFSHCGTDVFTLAKVDGAWRITGGSYTIQPQGCAPSPLGAP